jgi:hypothetical protein
LTEHGNVTTYEWRYGEAPLKIEAAAPADWDIEVASEPIVELAQQDKRKDSSDSDDFEKVSFGFEIDIIAAFLD